MTVLVSDSFNRADNATSLGNTDTGQTWQIDIGSFGILSNQGKATSTTNSRATIDSGTSNCTVKLTPIPFTSANNNATIQLIFRANPNNIYDYLYFERSPTKYSIVHRTASSGWTVLGTPSVTPSDNDIMSVTLNGNTIQAAINGTTIWTGSDTTNQTYTKYGFGMGGNVSTIYVDNLEIDSLTSSTTYIGSGTATGTSRLTSNETLILSEHGTVTGQSNNTSNETFVGATGTTYSASGTVTGKSNLTSSETLILKATGNAQGQSSLTSNEHEILSASGTIQGSSSLQSNENLIQHTGTIYSASGTVTGQSNLSSKETMSLSTNGEVKGQSNLTSNEKLRFFVTGLAQGQSSLKSNEKFISVKQIISRVTLQGSRDLHVILEGNRELHVILKGGVDVPAENQNLTLEAGTDKIIDIPNIVDSTSPLDLTTCLEVHYQAKSGSTVITKDQTNGITVTSPTDLSIALVPADSHGLSGFFKHEVWCVDSNGKKSLLTKGNLIIKPSYADVN